MLAVGGTCGRRAGPIFFGDMAWSASLVALSSRAQKKIPRSSPFFRAPAARRPRAHQSDSRLAPRFLSASASKGRFGGPCAARTAGGTGRGARRVQVVRLHVEERVKRIFTSVVKKRADRARAPSHRAAPTGEHLRSTSERGGKPERSRAPRARPLPSAGPSCRSRGAARRLGEHARGRYAAIARALDETRARTSADDPEARSQTHVIHSHARTTRTPVSIHTHTRPPLLRLLDVHSCKANYIWCG